MVKKDLSELIGSEKVAREYYEGMSRSELEKEYWRLAEALLEKDLLRIVEEETEMNTGNSFVEAGIYESEFREFLPELQY